MKKTICLLLALLTLTALCACAPENEGDDPAQTTAAPSDAADTTSADESSDTTPAEVTTGADEIDELGDVKFNNAVFDILTRKSTSYEIKSDELSGDLVRDAVYERNSAVEDRFAVDINIIELDGDWGARDTFMAAVANSVLGGTHDYDLVMTHSAYIVNIAAKGYGYDLNSLDEIDFDKKWWCRKYVDNASMFDRAYTAMGDLGYTLYQYMECVFFNKTLTEKASLPDLYAMVKDGSWTYDKMKEFSLLIGEDLNGDGVRNDSDLYGLAVNGHACRMTATFWDAGLTKTGADGKQVINIPNEKYLGIYDRLYDLVYNNKDNVHFAGEGATQTKFFINDQFMFFVEKLGNAEQMKDMASEYGILPFPKYDAAQENYISSARDALSAYLVVSDITEPEMVATVTEALCMIGYQKITPAYYETSLKLKYLNDPVAMEMLDLIRDTMTFEFAATYTNSIDLIYSILGDNVKNNVASISATVKGKSKVLQKLVDTLYAGFEKLDH